MATRAEWQANQRLMNKAVRRMRIAGERALIVDGNPGPTTRKRIHDLKFFLGWDGDRTQAFTQKFHYAIKYPFSARYVGGPNVIARGRQRVRVHNAAWHKSQQQGHGSRGVATFDGRAVAGWMVPYLAWARAHGWRGRLVSGYRTPEYSEQLCYRMCGRPTCPGRCAGRNTNHAKAVKPGGAIDVTDYYTFGRLMRQCPLNPHIYNALGSRDPVHFSASGR